MVTVMTKIYLFGAVVLSIVAGCTKPDADWSDCAKITVEQEKTQCLAHQEATKETGLTKVQQSPPKKW